MHLSADYSMLISIIDDSLTSPFDKLKCLLFARDPSSLPDANVGDIVRFHRLKVNAHWRCEIILFIVHVATSLLHGQLNINPPNLHLASSEQ